MEMNMIKVFVQNTCLEVALMPYSQVPNNYFLSIITVRNISINKHYQITPFCHISYFVLTFKQLGNLISIKLDTYLSWELVFKSIKSPKSGVVLPCKHCAHITKVGPLDLKKNALPGLKAEALFKKMYG